MKKNKVSSKRTSSEKLYNLLHLATNIRENLAVLNQINDRDDSGICGSKLTLMREHLAMLEDLTKALRAECRKQ